MHEKSVGAQFLHESSQYLLEPVGWLVHSASPTLAMGELMAVERSARNRRRGVDFMILVLVLSLGGGLTLGEGLISG